MLDLIQEGQRATGDAIFWELCKKFAEQTIR